MRKLQIPLHPRWRDGVDSQPVAVVNGSGVNTYLWIGDDTGFYSFTPNATPAERANLRRLAESILRRLAKS